ncbi:type II secretion system F family protein, partial [Segeticoccus rhizosphaerae]|uniref:type II secretion system F family protein n=1 Tax=Segeticoccus rhizosphaerae TaxID=1104777 RepID=UPI003B846E3A
AGLAGVLEALAQSVAEDVRARRQVEADRAKPRATARWITLITVAVLGFLALTGRYIAPFGTPVGQVILLVLLAAYVGVLVWMKTMTRGTPLPRFIGSGVGGQA